MNYFRKKLIILASGIMLPAFLGIPPSHAQETNVSELLTEKLEASLSELSSLRAKIAEEKIPLSKILSAEEAAQIEAKRKYDETKRQLDRRNLDLNNIRNEINSREQEKSYISSLLGEYVRNFETRLHIAELARYHDIIEKTRLAPENSNLKPSEVFDIQISMIDASVKRLEQLIGGDKFEGRAAGSDGLVKQGTFLFLGPAAYFASDDGSIAGIAEQKLGSLEPTVIPYANPEYVEITKDVVKKGEGRIPFDPSLGNARKIEETKETFREHLNKGGPVVWPIVGLAVLVIFVSLAKWVTLSLVRMPSGEKFESLLQAVMNNDKKKALEISASFKGPAGMMFTAGAENLDAPKDLIEELMFEKLLKTRYRLNKALPLISVSAACAPLLGLLGTVTGIIGTFKLITVFGSGDVKMLSAGISEALITTELGLCVAIPSLVSHSFLSRKAKAIVDELERMAISFISEVEKAKITKK